MKRILRYAAAFFLAVLSLHAWPREPRDRVMTGIEVLESRNPGFIKGRKIGIVTNKTTLDSRMRTTVEVLAAMKDTRVAAIYSPEHGFTGGRTGDVEDQSDSLTGIRIFSLHGKTRRPTGKMLEGIDMLVFDMQDIGVRSYTYASTMKNCMEEAARRSIPFVVLDRPNPLGGLLVDGPVLDMGFSSFIGPGPVAYVHGMTMGELAGYFNTELGINCKLTVVPMEGWKRWMRWQDTGLTWTPTSPNIPESDTPLFYATTGILGELPLVSIGVGYTLPFKIFGAPWIDPDRISKKLNSMKLPGVFFQPFYFTPRYHHFKDTFCGGSRIIITDENSFRPVETGYHVIGTLISMYPDNFDLSKISGYAEGMFNQANGTDLVLKMFREGKPAEEIVHGYQQGLESFMEQRKKYLLYE